MMKKKHNQLCNVSFKNVSKIISWYCNVSRWNSFLKKLYLTCFSNNFIVRFKKGFISILYTINSVNKTKFHFIFVLSSNVINNFQRKQNKDEVVQTSRKCHYIKLENVWITIYWYQYAQHILKIMNFANKTTFISPISINNVKTY